jgi:hypothetical protein
MGIDRRMLGRTESDPIFAMDDDDEENEGNPPDYYRKGNGLLTKLSVN